MANYIPTGAGYTPIGGQAFRSPKKKFPHLKGIERERALYEQERNPRQPSNQGYGGLADKYAQNAIDTVTNLPASMSEFDLGNVRNNLAKSGELEALNLFNNYQQKLPGSAEALMEFRNMRQAQQQFAQRQAAQPQNPYTPPAQNKPLYVPSGQPQPPSNVPQLATDASTSIGNMLSSAMPKPAPRGSGVNIDPSLWTPEAMARANPYGANSRPLPTHPNDMRGQARGYGLVSSSGGSSSIAPAGGKVAGWSPTYSGDRQGVQQRTALPQVSQEAVAQPSPFDLAGEVARRRAALDAKYPTDNIKPMNRLERQALAGPSPVAVPYGRDRPVVGRTLTDPATQLTPTPSWRDDYLKQNPTPYTAPQGTDLDLPNYSNKNQKMYSQPVLNAANLAGSAAGRYADDTAGRATGLDLYRETITDPMQLRTQAGAAGVSGKLGAFESEYDKWLKYQGGVDKQFDAQTARRKLMIDNLARNPYMATR